MNWTDYSQVVAVVLAGVAALKVLLGMMKRQEKFLERLVENHLAHNTKALEELRLAVKELGLALTEFRRPQ